MIKFISDVLLAIAAILAAIGTAIKLAIFMDPVDMLKGYMHDRHRGSVIYDREIMEAL